MKSLKFFLILLLTINNSVYSQVQNTLLRPANEVIVYRDTIMIKVYGTDNLKGINLSFNGNVKNFGIDTSNNNIIVFLKYKNSDGYKEVICYDYLHDTIKWNYRTVANECMFLDDYTVLFYQGNIYESKFFILDSQTGLPKSVTSALKILHIPEKNIFISFPYYGGKKVHLHEMQNFGIIGSTGIETEYSFSGYALNDSNLYLNIDGIHAFDDNYNLLWKSKMYTTDLHIDISFLLSPPLIMSGIGVLAGFIPFSGPLDYSRSLHSNMLFVNQNLIISDKNKLVSYNKEKGTENWSTKLPRMAGNSYLIYIKDSILLFCNKALCSRNHSISKFGEPYFISYNINNGQIKNHIKINESKYITDFIEKDKNTIVLLNNQLIEFHCDEIIKQKIFNLNDTLGDFYGFLSNSLVKLKYYDSFSGVWCDLDSLKQTDTDLLVFSSNGFILFNEKFEVVNFMPMVRFGIVKYEKEDVVWLETFSFYKNKLNYNGLVKYHSTEQKTTPIEIQRVHLLDKNRLYLKEKESISVFSLD
ncbi:MAG: hypothetical protein JXB00_13590 [Bacteroidales bacterium]|nr:hypothetical protein [Bacteroidales bacterium]